MMQELKKEMMKEGMNWGLEVKEQNASNKWNNSKKEACLGDISEEDGSW